MRHKTRFTDDLREPARQQPLLRDRRGPRQRVRDHCAGPRQLATYLFLHRFFAGYRRGLEAKDDVYAFETEENAAKAIPESGRARAANRREERRRRRVKVRLENIAYNEDFTYYLRPNN